MSFVKQRQARQLAAMGFGLWLLTSGCVSEGGRLQSWKKRPPAPAAAALPHGANPAANSETNFAATPRGTILPTTTPQRVILQTGARRRAVPGDVVQAAFASTQVVAPDAPDIDNPDVFENPDLNVPPELKLTPLNEPLFNNNATGKIQPPGFVPDEFAPITLHFDEMEIRQALEMLSRMSRLNILVSPGVTGKISAELKGVTEEEGLQAMLKLCSLVARREKDIVYVYTRKELADLVLQEADGPQVMKVYRLNYIRSSEFSMMIRPFLSEKGRLTSTPPAGTGIGSSTGGAGGGSGGGSSAGGSGGGSTGGASGGTSGGGGSTGGASGGDSGGASGAASSPDGGDAMAGGDQIVVQDTEAVLQIVDRLKAKLDVQPKQVLIEAVIMTLTRTNERDLGVNYAVLDGAGRVLTAIGAGAAINAAAGFDPTQVLAAGSPTKTTGATLVTEGGKLAGDGSSGFAANTQGIKFGFVDNNVTGFIRALESMGETTVLASPRLLVLNKQRAELQLGDRLGFRTLTQTQTSTIQRVEFLNVGTQLYLRPFISDDGMVRMEIHPERSEGSVVDNIPQTRTSQITTNVMVPDGATIVIGGLMESADSIQQSGIPGLSRLPYLGALFRNKVTSSAKKELIVLLTPRIWKQNSEHLPLCPPPTNLLIPTYNTAEQP